MKPPALLFLAALSCLPALDLRADETVETTVTAEKEKVLLSAAQIDELLAPIALYPDPLVALILPAATFPTDIVLAARHLKADGDLEAVEEQSWDDSVKALARYPDVVKWMDENLAWTQQVGAAFLMQPAAVMNGTQRLRAAAIAAGNLKTTPEQTVVVEREVVRIVPAQREIIYVPVYDPVWVYRPRPVEVYYPGPLVTFSVGYRTGFWLSYYCNWGYNTVVIINRPYRTVVWQSHPGWSCPPPAVVQVHHHHVWRPAPVRVQAVCRDFERRPVHHVARPTANSYVQRGSQRDSSSPGITRSDTGEHRQNRPERTGATNRDVATTTDTPVSSPRNRDDRLTRSESNERTRIEPTFSDRNQTQRRQPDRQVLDRSSRTSPTNPSPGGSVVTTDVTTPSSPVPNPVTAETAPDRVRPSRAPTVVANADRPSPRGQERRETRATGSVGPSPAPVSSTPSRAERGQDYRRPQTASTRPTTNEVTSTAPAATRSQATTAPARQINSRSGGFSNPSASASPPASSATRSQRQTATTSPERTPTARQETASTARASRQSRMTEPAAPSSSTSDPEATNTRTRR